MWTRKKKEAALAEFNDKTYPDVMVDLETMGTHPSTQVISMGAVRFRLGVRDDIYSIKEPSRNFYRRLSLSDQESLGRTVDGDTLDWWSKQSKAARRVFDEEEQDVHPVLEDFTKFCSGAKRIWGNGNMFDNAIVRSLYDDYDRVYPVEYWKDLDMRTLTYLWNFLTNWRSKGKRPDVILGDEHNALDDARRQVLQVQIMINEIKGLKDEL